jgi:hypothetical protein
MRLLDAAYGYAEQGWPIIPIAPRRKRPYIRTGRDHADGASTDADVIRAWVVRWPDMELGIPTGWPTGTVVVDIDPPDGDALLSELERDDVLGPLPRAVVSRSPRGGRHIYCRRPAIEVRIPSGAGPSSRLGRLLAGRAGVDIRADGGLVVLPPSSGRAWLGIVDDVRDLPELPARWLAAIVVDDPPPPPRRPVVVSGDRTSRLARARAYIDRIPPTVQRDHGGDGGGQSAIWIVACRAIHGFGLGEDEARALIEEWCARCVPPWSEREIEHTLASARRADPARWVVDDREARHG